MKTTNTSLIRTVAASAAAMFATAATMMSRRGQRWTPEHADFYLDLYERTSGGRHSLLRDTEQRRLRSAI